MLIKIAFGGYENDTIIALLLEQRRLDLVCLMVSSVQLCLRWPHEEINAYLIRREDKIVRGTHIAGQTHFCLQQRLDVKQQTNSWLGK